MKTQFAILSLLLLVSMIPTCRDDGNVQSLPDTFKDPIITSQYTGLAANLIDTIVPHQMLSTAVDCKLVWLVLDVLHRHVLYYPITLVRIISALTQESHGNILRLTIVTVHHVTITPSLRDYVMLPSLIVFTDYLAANERTYTHPDYLEQFNVWNKTMDVLQEFSRVVKAVFCDDKPRDSNQGHTARVILDMLYNVVSIVYWVLKPINTVVADMTRLNYMLASYRDYISTFNISTWMLPCCTFCWGKGPVAEGSSDFC